MDNLCGKPADSLRKQHRKTGARLSPVAATSNDTHTTVRVQHRLIPRFSERFHSVFPHTKIALLPLVEHIFYPVSTATYYKNHRIKI